MAKPHSELTQARELLATLRANRDQLLGDQITLLASMIECLIRASEAAK
jgi:hypothetical protein